MMQDQIFKMKFAAKQLARESARSEKDQAKEKAKIKKAMTAGNNDIARIHAENAIRHHNQSINYLRLSSRMEAVVQRMQSAQQMKNLTKNMSGVTNSMNAAIKSMNPEQITKTMDVFEKQFEDLDVQAAVMEDSMQTTVSSAAPESEVDAMMAQIADEHGLEVEAGMADAGKSELTADEVLEERLKKLTEMKM